jgi:hypothetical protein
LVRIVLTSDLPMSWTSPKTVAITTLPLVWPVDPVEVVLELGDRALHHFGRLQDEGQDQFAGAELVADLLHRRQQHLVEGRDGADLLDRAVDPVLDALLLAAQDVPVQRLLGLHALGRVGGLRLASSPFDSKWAMKRSSASSRRLKTRSSVSSRSSSEISE